MDNHLLLLLFALIILVQSIIANQFFDKSIPDTETVLTEEDFQRIRRRQKRQTNEVQQQPPENIDDSAMYNKDRFEGDIVNPGLNARTMKSADDESQTKIPGLMRNAVRQPYLKWPNAKIPYTVSKQYTTFGRDRIAQALEDYRTQSCVEFRPKTDADSDYVHIFPDDGCYSLVGKVGGKQPVSLGDGCMSKGIIIHELMHAVGFFHEQSRADRDEYVNVVWDNIEKGLRDQFDKYSLNMIDYLGAKYDYGSVMHYGPLAFSKNGKPTLEPKQKGMTIGQRIGFSTIDLYKINRLYNCPNQPAQPQTAAVQQPSSSSATTGNGPLISGGSSSSTGGDNNSRCADLRPDCAYLANRGHCESIFSSAFMQANCAQSCEKCGGPGGAIACNDQREWCTRWASNGMCDLYIFQQYMHLNCPRACALC